MIDIKDILKRHNLLIFIVFIFGIFIFLHLSGIHGPYHQDEYKWVQYSHPEIIAPGTVPHPPLTEFIYTKIAPVFGDNGFRFVPFIFGAINFFLLFYLVSFLFGRVTAKISIIIFTFSFFSLLSTLMVDVDGAVMPFFFLVMAIGYYRWKNNGFKFHSSNHKWLILLLTGAIGGFMIKVSFILAIAAVFVDFLFERKVFSDWRKAPKYLGFALAGGGVLFVLLFLSKFIFPFFNLSYAFGYWEHFIVADRGWSQTFIQCVKGALYSSPFLVLLPFFAGKEILSKARVFVIFLVLAFIFYIVLFDFSIGALDRYLQLLIIPLTILSSAVLSQIDFKGRRVKEFLFLGTVFSLVLILLQSLPHYVPPLHPKAEWISRIMSLRWTFLYPFSGGSGPLGFYVSFLVIATAWIVSAGLVFVAIIKSEYKKLIIIFLIPIGFTYNLIFTQEYLVGHWNGYAPKLLSDAVDFMKSSNDIKKVTVYNDNGGYDVRSIDKYDRRLYIDPKFEVNIQEKIDYLNTHKEHYFVLDVPRFDSNTIYQKYFNSCVIVYEAFDKKMSATVYDCRKAPDIKI